MDNFKINEKREFRTRREDSDSVEDHVDEELENNDIGSPSATEEPESSSIEDEAHPSLQNSDEASSSLQDDLLEIDYYKYESLEAGSSEHDDNDNDDEQNDSSEGSHEGLQYLYI